MPTYEYHCQKCEQNFEAFQSMRDQPFRECPKELCRLPKWGHGKVKRLLGTGAGIIFKGSGFYAEKRRGGRKSCRLKRSREKFFTWRGKGNGEKIGKRLRLMSKVCYIRSIFGQTSANGIAVLD